MHLPSAAWSPSISKASIRRRDAENAMHWPRVLRMLLSFRWGFRALETLELTEMRALEEWREVHINDFPRLDELAISTCPKLYRLPDCLSSLAKLEINDCKVLTTFPKLPSLTGLKLWGSCNWHIWSVSLDLPNLEYLQISNYDRPTLDFYPNLPALKVLTIECCKNLEKAAGSHHLISLQSLEIYSCPKFQGLTDKHLHPQFAVFLGLGESKPPLPYSKARDRRARKALALARLMQKEDFNSHQERISQFNLFLLIYLNETVSCNSIK
uniref:Uncharacterized protein n=1 Tax=Ananas comosus var. bracteatus TaxID=296719 RepID=A0A6V7PRM0_ANACO|nr:unnamed protein product [Ananas comosus var. bracteatus]